MLIEVSFLLAQCILYNQYGLSNGIMGNVVHVSYGAYPWIVSIKNKNDMVEEQEKFHGCTGSLISPKHVLTVEHGVNVEPLEGLEVRLGTIDLRDGRYRYNVTDFISYEEWTAEMHYPRVRDYANDVAILTLDGQVPNYIKPVHLSFLPMELVTGLQAYVAGWGRKMDDKARRFMVMGAVNILTREGCKNRVYNLTGAVTDIHLEFICTAAEPFVTLRKGDSGGPLFLPDGGLIAINRASCPSPEHVFNERKINIHIALRPYRQFIATIMTR